MSDLDDEEIIVTRKLNGVDDNLYREEKEVILKRKRQERQKLAIKRLELNKNTEIYVDYKNKKKTDDIQVVLDMIKEKIE